MNKILYTVSLLMFIALTSCDDDSPTSGLSGCQGGNCVELYMPLEVGNYWVYEYRLFEQGSNFENEGLTFDGIQDTFEILEAVNFEGKSAFRATPFITDGIDGDSYWSIENNRLYLWIDYGKTNDSVINTFDFLDGQGWVQVLKLATDTVVSYSQKDVVDIDNGTRTITAGVKNYTYLSPVDYISDGNSRTCYISTIQTMDEFRDTINGVPASYGEVGNGRIYIFAKEVGLVQHTFRFEQQNGQLYQKIRTLVGKGKR